MSEHLIASLRDVVLSLQKLIKNYLDKILAALEPLKKLPELIESIGRKILEGIRDQIQAMGEMEIYIRLSQMRSKKVLVSEEEESIRELENQLKEDLEKIRNRYDRIQEELNQEAYSRVYELDKHLIEIYEKYFPRIFSNPVAEKIEPYYNEFFASTRDAYEERLSYFWEHVNKLVENLQNFVNTRKSYSTNIESYLHPYELKNPEIYLLPVVFVEYEDKNESGIVTETLLPYSFSFNSSAQKIEDLSPELVVDSNFRPIFQYIENNEIIKSKLKWKTAGNFKNKLIYRIENLINTTNVSRNLLKGFVKNIEDSSIEILKEMET